MNRGCVCTALTLLLLASGLAARTRVRTKGAGGISLRKRTHVNTLIAEPGTGEIDWAQLYSFSSRNWTMPSTLRYTPKGGHLLWGRTEYSAAFESFTNLSAGDHRVTQTGDAVTLSATTVVVDGEKFDIAVAPQATLFLRNESGARLGATAIARYDAAGNSLSSTLTWSAATQASDGNPARITDVGFGFGRRLGTAGLAQKLSPHVNAVWERATGLPGTFSLFEGMEYQVSERVAFDVSGQHFNLRGGAVDHQIVAGFTFNLARR